MLKNLCSFLAGVGMLGVTILPLLAGDHIGWLRWRIPIVGVGIVAFVALAVQIRLQFLEERRGRKDQETRDRKFEELTNCIIAHRDAAKLPSPKQQVSTELSAETGNPLRAKVLQLAHDLFAFLREKGPEPEAPISDSMTTREKLAAIVGAMWPYNERVHHGYQHRFSQRVIDMFHELAEFGISPGLEPWEIDSGKVGTSAETVRRIAERLFLVAAQMDIADQRKGP